jgi:hypothetical protein
VDVPDDLGALGLSDLRNILTDLGYSVEGDKKEMTRRIISLSL